MAYITIFPLLTEEQDFEIPKESGSLDFSRKRVYRDLNGKDINVAGDLNLERFVAGKDVNLEGAVIDGTLNLKSSRILSYLILKDAAIKQINGDDLQFGHYGHRVSEQRGLIAENLKAERCSLCHASGNPMIFRHANIGNFLVEAFYSQDFDISEAVIGVSEIRGGESGYVNLNNSLFDQLKVCYHSFYHLSLNNCRIGSLKLNVNLSNDRRWKYDSYRISRENGVIDLRGTVVDKFEGDKFISNKDWKGYVIDEKTKLPDSFMKYLKRSEGPYFKRLELKKVEIYVPYGSL